MSKFNEYLKETIEIKTQIGDMILKNCQPYLKEIKKNNIIKFLYRGTDENVPDIRKKSPRKDRKPRDTYQGLHDMMNDYFRKFYGWKARSEGVFVIGHRKPIRTNNYGKPYIFIPIGKYEYLWNPNVEDLYAETDNENFLPFEDWGMESDWNDRYGEGGEGTWVYNGEELSIQDRDDAFEYLENEYGEEFDEYKLVWEPEISYEEFMKEKEDEHNEKMEEELEYIIKSYQNTKGLKSAINSKHEIMFRCKEYYLINTKYTEYLEKILFGM